MVKVLKLDLAKQGMVVHYHQVHRVMYLMMLVNQLVQNHLHLHLRIV